MFLWQFDDGLPAFGIETALVKARSAPEKLYDGNGDGHRELRWLTDDEVADLLRDAWEMCFEAGGQPLSKPELAQRKRRKG